MQAGDAAANGILRVYPNAEIMICPLADDGAGTTNALISCLNGTYKTVTVADSLGRPIQAQYGILPNQQTAVIEMAAASGLSLLSENERNPMDTTTYGFGEMIHDAIRNGFRNFILGIGGSATNDGGIGCLQALEFDLLDKNGKSVSYRAKGPSELIAISDINVIPELKECIFHIACDVKNPLCGENGCSNVFAPQKGADKLMIAQMDAYLQHYAELTKVYHLESNSDYPGARAVGGLGFGLMSYLNAELEPLNNVIHRESRHYITFNLPYSTLRICPHRKNVL